MSGLQLLVYAALSMRPYAFAARGDVVRHDLRLRSVSICATVPVKQVNCVPRYWLLPEAMLFGMTYACAASVYLCYCTSKASKLSSWRGVQRSSRRTHVPAS